MPHKQMIEIPHQILEEKYNSIKNKQNPWLIISAMNMIYNVDHILLKYAYDHYPQKATLSDLANVLSFYEYVFDKLHEIEKEYLNNELQMDDDGTVTNKVQFNLKSIATFIKDEQQHYQAVLREFSETINEDKIGINGSRIYQLFKNCFDTQFTRVLYSNSSYFEKNVQENRIKFEQFIKEYAMNKGNMSEDEFMIQQFWLEEGQIKAFLNTWIRQSFQEQLYIIYGRTEERFNQISFFMKIKNKQSKNKALEKLKQKEKARINDQKFHEVIKNETKPEKLISFQEEEKYITPKKEKLPQKVQKFRRNKFTPTEDTFENYQPKQNQKAKQKSKQISRQKSKSSVSKKQLLFKKIPKLFEYGCKKRYVLWKGTTFDQIDKEGKNMSLQKFINLCNYFEISSIISRQNLSEIFKINAINRLILDEQRFGKVIMAIVQIDERAIDMLLSQKQKVTQFKSLEKLSNYKFVLRALNGKSVDTIRNQLNLKKLAKQKVKEQINLSFNKKMLALKRKNQVAKQNTQRSRSTRALPSSTSVSELHQQKQQTENMFDPQQIFGNDFDEILDAYESKLPAVTKVPRLQSILSKRLQRGNRIIQRINSHFLKQYQ